MDSKIVGNQGVLSYQTKATGIAQKDDVSRVSRAHQFADTQGLNDRLIKTDSVKVNFTSSTGVCMTAHLSSKHFALLHFLPFLDSATCDDIIKSVLVPGDLTTSDVQTHLVPAIERLSDSKEPHARMSACSLICIGYPRATGPTKERFRCLFFKFSWDEPNVRERVAETLGEFTKVISQDFRKLCLLILQRFVCDTFSGVRIKTVKAGVSIAALVSPEQSKAVVFPVLQQMIKDISPDVRLEVAKNITGIQKTIGKGSAINDVVPLFQTLLRDLEPEIRAISTKQIVDFCSNIDKRFQRKVILQTILPEVLKLGDDSCAKVRLELASVVMDLCPIFCKKNINRSLWQVFLLLLGDCSNEVRIKIISNLSGMTSFLSLYQFDKHITPFIKYLAANKEWRARLKAVQCIFQIGSKMGTKFFGKKLIDICGCLLVDSTHAVREEMSIVIGKVAGLFDPYWAKDNLFQLMLPLANSPRYLHRLICISCIQNLVPPCGSEISKNLLLPMLLTLSKDTVPNVRFNVAKTLQKIAKVIDKCYLETEILPILFAQILDSDFDVKYFAEEAILVVCKIIEEGNTQKSNDIQLHLTQIV